MPRVYTVLLVAWKIYGALLMINWLCKIVDLLMHAGSEGSAGGVGTRRFRSILLIKVR